jgi:hypothetical protein
MAEDTTIAKQAASHTGRYRLNLILLVALMIFLAVWFEKHLQIYVTEILLVSGTLSLWALWQIVQSWLQWGWDEEAKEMKSRLLGARPATEYLVFALLILLVLWFTTSSVYVVYEGDTKGQNSFKIQVLSDGKPFLPPLDLTSYDRVAGRPFFLRWHSIDLSFEVTEPRGYEARTERLSPWTGIHLRVPADFTAKKFRVLRVVPLRAYNLLSPANLAAPDTQYSLRISRGGICGASGANVENFIINDVHRQSLYIGAAEEELKWLIDKRDQQKFQRDFTNALARNQVPEARRSEWMREWEAAPRFVSQPVFHDGDQVCIQILQGGQQLDPPMQMQVSSLTFEEEIRSEYMEGGQ